MNKILPIFLLFLFASCSLEKSKDAKIEGKWILDKASRTTIITSETPGGNQREYDDAFLETGKDDYLNINTDGTFKYEIKEEDISALGTWEYIKEDKEFYLYLSYFEPSGDHPHIRKYKVYLTSEKLSLTEFTENKILEFQYNKEIKQYASTKSSGMSIFSLLRGLLGLCSLLFIAFLCSRNRKAINWSLVLRGLLLQFIIAILILKVPFIQSIFDSISSVFVKILEFTAKGSEFLFGGFMNTDSYGYIFAFQVLPTIIFFSAITSLLFYYGVLQKIVYLFARMMKKILRLSGSESLAAAGNIFLGQTESPLLIKPYIEKMTKSELLCLMAGGMATIAGGVLASYIGFLGGDDPEQKMFFAKHLLMASVMSAPAAIVAAKILLPETEKFDEKMEISQNKLGSNALESISIGTIQGLKLAVNVGAMLLVFIALVAMINYFFDDFIGEKTGLNSWILSATEGRYDGFSLQFILGYLFAPISWIIGVAKEDIFLVGQLLGEKTILNEFYAYTSLGSMRELGLLVNEKSIIISTYVLCGFANLSSIGIQIGGIGSLAPKRRGDLSKLGILSLIAGTIACLFTGAIVGMVL